MRAVNLLPDPRIEKRPADGLGRTWTTKTIALVASGVLVVIAALLAVTFVHAHSDASARQKTLDGLQAQVADLQASAAATAAQAGKRQAHLAAVTSASSGHVSWDDLLEQLARVMPRGAWLESLQADGASQTTTSSSSSTSPSSTSEGSAVVTSNGLSSSSSSSSTGTAAQPTGVVLTGYALSQDVVAQALSRLALMPALSDIALQSTERADVGSHKAVQFTINANVRFAGGNR